MGTPPALLRFHFSSATSLPFHEPDPAAIRLSTGWFSIYSEWPETPLDGAGHAEFHLLFYAFGQPLDLVGLADDIKRERVLAGLVDLDLEVAGQLEQFCAVVDNLLLSLQVGDRRVPGVLFLLLLLHFHDVIGIRRAICLGEQNGCWTRRSVGRRILGLAVCGDGR